MIRAVVRSASVTAFVISTLSYRHYRPHHLEDSGLDPPRGAAQVLGVEAELDERGPCVLAHVRVFIREAQVQALTNQLMANAGSTMRQATLAGPARAGTS